MPISDQSSITGTFGPNLWLVEEMYQLFLDDPSAVDASWHEFFADYQPASAGEGGRADTTTPTAASASRSAPAGRSADSASRAARPASSAEEGTTTPAASTCH
jgi:2-oxoglutarate decarboxylase